VDYAVSLADSGRYVLIKVFVPITNEIGRRCGTDASRLGDEKNVNRYLFDLRDSPNVQTVAHNYDFAYREMASFGFSRRSCSALLVRPNDRSHDFIETAFRNAGYVVRLFSDEASAIAWIEKA
jgi:hypothetical protein